MPSFARSGLAVVAALSFSVAVPALAQAKIRIKVDLDRQTMHVEAGDKVFDWKVSSGKVGYETPAGNFHVLWMDKDHHSDTYDGAFMPNAIFFAPGYAIHGYGKSPWGHKASHGCIRIPVAKSALLFDLVQAEKGADVTITGYSPTVAPTVASVEAARAPKQIAPIPEEGPAGPDGEAAPEAERPPLAPPPTGTSYFGGFY